MGKWNDDMSEAFQPGVDPKDEIDACLDILNKCDELEGNATNDDS